MEYLNLMVRHQPSTSEQQEQRFGPYRLVRALEAGPLGERWLAVHEVDLSSHVVHRFAARPDKSGQRRFLSAVESVAGLEHPHLAPVEMFALCPLGRGCIVTPYTGNQDGLVTLDALVAAKGGRLTPIEAERAVTHLLEAMEYAEGRGVMHGPLSGSEVVVDRHGRVSIELYGLGMALAGQARNSELVRDEVRSAVEIAYRLITGLPAEEPRIAAGKLVKKLEPAWDEWLERGLAAAGGFATAAEARAFLPSVREIEEPVVSPVKLVLGRIRRLSASR